MPRQAPVSSQMMQVSGIARLVGAQRTVQNNGNLNSEPKCLACEESPIRAFYFWAFGLLSLSWCLQWTDFFAFFLRVSSCRLRSALLYALDFANHVRCEGPAVLSSPSSGAMKHHPEVASKLCTYQAMPAWVPRPGPGREQKLTFRVWPQIDVPKQYHKLTFLSVTNTYIRT